MLKYLIYYARKKFSFFFCFCNGLYKKVVFLIFFFLFIFLLLVHEYFKIAYNTNKIIIQHQSVPRKIHCTHIKHKKYFLCEIFFCLLVCFYLRSSSLLLLIYSVSPLIYFLHLTHAKMCSIYIYVACILFYAFLWRLKWNNFIAYTKNKRIIMK